MRSAESWISVVHPVAHLSTVDELKRQIERIQRDALLAASEIARKEGEGAPDEIYEAACRNVHDAILERAETLTPHFHSTSGGKNE